MAKVVVGYLVTLPDGYECRLGPDYTRALHYAAQQHAKLEMMFVERPATLALRTPTDRLDLWQQLAIGSRLLPKHPR